MTPFFAILLAVLSSLLASTLLFFWQIHVLRGQISEALAKDEGRPLRMLGPAFGLPGLYQDINRMRASHRRFVDESLEEQERLQEQIRHISHDLRTPLTSILGYIELVEEAEDPRQAREQLGVVKKRALLLRDLLDDFHDLATLEAKPLDMESLRASSVLEESLLLFHQSFELAGLDLELSLSKGPLRESSHRLLTRIYGNLLRNILDYAEQKAKIQHGVDEHGEYSRFSNQMPAGSAPDLRRIFERFYREDPSRQKSATGLGLYLSRVFMERLGGRLDAQVEGRWIHFILRYPSK